MSEIAAWAGQKDQNDLPFFEDHHRQLSQDLEAWAAQNLQNISHKRSEARAACRTLVMQLGAAGWLKYTVPKAQGGVFDKLDVRSLCLIRETLARHDGLADFAFAMQGLGSATISLYGSDAQKKEYLEPIGRGERIAAFALSEPNAGSDVAAMSCSYRYEGGDIILNGEKTWISNGGIAHQYVVFARLETENSSQNSEGGSKGISAFIIEADAVGLDDQSEPIEVSAPHPLSKLIFKNCRVKKTAMIGEEGRGFAYAMATLDIFRSTVGAAALGFAKCAAGLAISRVKSRDMFGGKMADLQIIQSKIGDMSLNIEASALLIYRAAWVKDLKADRVTKEASMAKLFATEAAQKIIDDAVQIFGGRGVVYGEKVEKLYREIRSLRIYEGASEVQKLIIAGQAMKDK
jgi:alkylation response protein AidB-like acyl-CoA dehydrogenase